MIPFVDDEASSRQLAPQSAPDACVGISDCQRLSVRHRRVYVPKALHCDLPCFVAPNVGCSVSVLKNDARFFSVLGDGLRCSLVTNVLARLCKVPGAGSWCSLVRVCFRDGCAWFRASHSFRKRWATISVCIDLAASGAPMYIMTPTLVVGIQGLVFITECLGDMSHYGGQQFWYIRVHGQGCGI